MKENTLSSSLSPPPPSSSSSSSSLSTSTTRMMTKKMTTTTTTTTPSSSSSSRITTVLVPSMDYSCGLYHHHHQQQRHQHHHHHHVHYNYRLWLCAVMVVGLLSSVAVCAEHGADSDNNADRDSDISGILKRAEDFSNHLVELFNTVSGTGIYKRSDKLEVTPRSRHDFKLILDDTKRDMDRVMLEKERAVEALKDAAEQSMKDYGPYKTDMNFESITDFNAKKVVIGRDIEPLSNETQREIRETINYLPTREVKGNFKIGGTSPMLNIDTTSIHVPTNIYDKSMKILNGVKWTKSMNPRFVSNRKNDLQLTWQYFCSSDGFFRIYPGMQWPRDADRVDTFDCRVRQWYIQAATSPKNIIILLDTSGSMKGLRLSIAKSTVFTILDTLSDEDYFNVIQFSDEPQYVVDCFNGTLMPATVDNIGRMKGMIEELEAKKYANFEKALVTAFELFKREHRLNHEVKICNRAIMLITDGPPDSYDYIFKEYNWPNKTMRVFTFLIGKEVQDNRQARWMACANKGKFTHISTRADVQENVQKYVKVLSRPLAIRKESHKVWTPVYLDYVTLQDDILAHPGRHTQLELDQEQSFMYEGLGLIMSVSMPVFDTRPQDRVGPTEDDPTRNLLGVVGADLRINELLKLLPTYELGVNAYAFAITNHGYILFHPDYKPFYTEQLSGYFKLTPRTKYNSVELSEVERPAASERPDDNSEHPLSNYLLRSKSGEITFRVVTHMDNMKYVENRENVYKFVEISGAFRLAFVFPHSYGYKLYSITATDHIDKTIQDYMTVKGEFTNVEYSKWIYCKGKEDSGYVSLANTLLADLAMKGPQILKKYCNEKHAQHILIDVMVTAKYGDVWKGTELSILRSTVVNEEFVRYGSHCDRFKNPVQKMICVFGTHIKRHGIGTFWIGTRSGITRHLNVDQNRTMRQANEWMEQYSQTIKSSYYERAVSLWDQGYKYVFTGPVSTTQREFEYDNSFVTMAHVEVVGSNPRNEMPAAVLAFQMKYRAFYEKFVNFTFSCVDDLCSSTCNDTDTFNCFIIDNNGYVLASNNADMNGTSLFLGEHDGPLMRAMVDDRIFEEVQITDFQSTCRTRILSGQDNASNFIISPFQILSKIIVWFVTEIIIFVSQLTVMTWQGISGVVGLETAAVSEEGEGECGNWIPEAYVKYLFCGFVINSNTGERKAASFITQRRPCELKVTRYNLNLKAYDDKSFGTALPSCERQCRDGHQFPYHIKRLNQSNLFFVVSSALNCTCETAPSSSSFDSFVEEDEDEEEEVGVPNPDDRYVFSMKPTEKTYLENERCQRLRNLSDELKLVDKTRLSNTLCLDSSYEADYVCNLPEPGTKEAIFDD